jgi:hypothetical protein
MNLIYQIIAAAKSLATLPGSEFTISGYIKYFAAVIAISSLGSVAKMLGDHTGKITGRVVITYLITGSTAGLILALLTVEKYGESFLLIGISGVAGFGSVQILSVLSYGLQAVIKRIFGTK